MGGNKGGDRKSYQATSSAKAAEALAARGGASGGFGGFSGGRPVAGFGFGAAAAPAAAAASGGAAAAGGPAADPLELSAQLDGDLAQCLRHLSKRDTTTKMKALQSLRELVPQQPAPQLALLLSPWAYQFRRLLLDGAKSVRAEAAGVMGAIACRAGKGLLPHLKALLGPWLLACHDPYPDAAAAARRALGEAFPGRKTAGALVYCRSEVLAHIASSLAATPQSLGDPRKETPEELADRHERVTAAALAAAGALLATLQEQQQQQPEQQADGEQAQAQASEQAAAALQEVLDKLQELLAAPGFFKKSLGSKSAVVRRASYGIVSRLAAGAPQLLARDDVLPAAAPAVLGALQEKEPSNHAAMWEALLSFARATRPACWESVSLPKAVVPRLLALLRHGCFGSAAASLPALLPLLALLPRRALAAQPVLLLDSVLDALWAGLVACSGSAARAATAAAYSECLSWGLRNAAALAASDAAAGADTEPAAAAAPAAADGAQSSSIQYCQALLQGHFASLLQLALSGNGADASLAACVVRGVLLGQCGAAAAPPEATGGGSWQLAGGQSDGAAPLPMQLELLLSALGGAAQQQLVAGAGSDAGGQGAAAVCDSLQALFDALDSSSAPLSGAAAGHLAASCCGALLPLVQSGQQLPAAASSLLARLIREHPQAASGSGGSGGNAAAAGTAGTDSDSSSSSIAALVRLGISSCEPPGSQLAVSDADLLLSCLAGGAGGPGAGWGAVLALVAAAGPSAAAWRFLDALLRRAVAAPGGLADGWSHEQLDSLVQQLLQQQQAGSNGTAAAAAGGAEPGAWGLTRSEAAAASLLGCCLGANEAQQVLLSSASGAAVLGEMARLLEAAQQQQQGATPAAPHAVAAATVCVAALHAALSSARHAAGSRSASVWQQQPQRLVRLLVLLWQLSWGDAGELQLPDASAISDSSDSDDTGSERSSSSSVSSSEDEELSMSSEQGGDGADAAAAGAPASVAGANSSGAWRQLQLAAARVCTGDLLASALDELLAPAGEQLLQQLVELLASGLRSAALAAAADSSSSAAAVEAGLRWGNRAATVLAGVSATEQQEQLAQQLLAAVPDWQQWCAPGGTSSACNSSSAACWGLGGAVHTLVLQCISVLLLQAGGAVLLPLHAQHTSRDGEAAAVDSCGQQWLLVELLCSASCLQAHATDAAGQQDAVAQQLLHCVPAAAEAAQQHLLRAAGRGSSTGRGAPATARSMLASSVSQLSAAAQAAVASGADAAAAVYCSTLTGLLQHAVAACSARPAAQQHLLPVLQQFAAGSVAAAARSYSGQGTASSSSSAVAAAPAWMLVQVLEVLAAAFRFADSEACVTAAGLDTLSVAFMRQAMELPPPVQGSDDSSSGSIEAGAGQARDLLQLAVACFPVRFDQQQQHHHHHHHASSGGGTAPVQLAAGSSTQVERQALTALLRHVCGGSGPGGSGSSVSGSGSSTQTAGGAVELACRLQLCCVGYCWADMSAAEWHVVLRDCQARLTAVRRDAERAASGLAAAACNAAQQIAGGAAAAGGDPMTPTMAIEVLRRLARRGLLQRQVAIAAQLSEAADAAAAGLSPPGLAPALQLLVAVLQLQAQIQAAGRAPQLGLALSSAWRELLLLTAGLGAAAAVAAGCGPDAGALLHAALGRQGPSWRLLAACLAGRCEDDAAGKVLEAADDRAEMLGVDAVGSCLALLQAGGTAAAAAHNNQQQQQAVAAAAACEPLQQLAWRLLLHPRSLARITHAAAAADSASGGGGGEPELPEFGVDDDAAAFLVAVGLRPDMAAVLAAPRPWQPHLLHWALLLAHIAQLPGRSRGQRLLTQALRDVPELVPQLLERLVTLIGLGGSASKRRGGSGGTAAAAAAAAADGDGGDAAAAPGALSVAGQAALSARLQQLGTDGSSSCAWSLAAALRGIGLPASHGAWRLLAAGLYRAVLGSLPASARLWFSDQRDRGRAAAVEAYTSRHESPALLAAEFAAIKRDAGAAGGEVGGGACSFRVRASPAAREVAAVLDIEDGASLELTVKLPAAAPLKAAEVECRNKVGIKDGRLRKWLLSISVFLRNQNSGVLDAIGLWRANLEQEFEGVQPCLICYSVISAANGQLPRLSCKQCSVPFHPACLYKWFRSSGKSACPHCSALF